MATDPMIAEPGQPCAYMEGDELWHGVTCEMPTHLVYRVDAELKAWGWWRLPGDDFFTNAPVYQELIDDADPDRLLADFTAWMLTR